jgi:uncharacterized protein (DUF1800 family)
MSEAEERWSRRKLLEKAGAKWMGAVLPAIARTDAGAVHVAESLPVAEYAALAAPAPAVVDRPLHLISRTSFGARATEVERCRRIGAAAYLDEQLRPETIDDSAVAAVVAARYPTLAKSAPELAALTKVDDGPDIPAELLQATLYRRLASRRQLYEVMVEFWSDHFNIYHWKDDCYWLKTVDDREVIRKHALGKFRDLLRASAGSPAMLVYLDNSSNVAWGPNENYARELMELQTVGVDGGYTQADVVEVARCFTGWTVDWTEEREGSFLFDPQSHDTGAKRVLGTPVAAGQGRRDGGKVVEILAAHPVTSRFIAAKLCRRFVSDNPPASIVAAAAARFRATDGDIKAVLRTILTSAEFYAAAGQKLKRPVEFQLSALRALGARVSVPDGAEQMLWALYSLGQVPFDWAPPNGYPDAGPAWATTNGLLSRWNVAASYAESWWDGIELDTDALVGSSGARTVPALIDAFARRLLNRALPTADRARLAAYLAFDGPAGQVPEWYLRDVAPELLALILNSPHFQWR